MFPKLFQTLLRAPEDEGGSADPAPPASDPPAKETKAKAPAPDVGKTPEEANRGKKSAATTGDAIDEALNAVDVQDDDFDEGYEDPPEPKAKEPKPKEPKAKADKAKKADDDGDADADEDVDDDVDDDVDGDVGDDEDVDGDVDDDGDGDDDDDDDGDGDGDEDDDTIDPPLRLNSKDAKKEWEQAPKSVRDEVYRAIEELESGIRQHQAKAKTFEDEYEPFHNMMQATGQKFAEVQQRYEHMEKMLRENPLVGFQQIAYNLGTTMEDIATKVLNVPMDTRVKAYTERMKALQQDNIKIINEFRTFQKNQFDLNHQRAMQDLDEFRNGRAIDPHPRLNEPRFMDTFSFFYTSGRAKDLDEAYKMAENQHPKRKKARRSDRDKARRSVDEAAQTRRRPMQSSPTGGSNPRQDRAPAKSTEEAVRRGMRNAGLN